MLARTHVLSGEVAWLAAAPHWTHNGWHLALGAGLAGVAALGPDIDHGSSTASHRLWGPFHQEVGDRIGDAFGEHRMGTHCLASIPLVGMLAALTMLYPPLGGGWLPAAVTVGWAAHIAGDLLTKEGVGILYPWSRKRYRLAITFTVKLPSITRRLRVVWKRRRFTTAITTGKAAEKAIRVCLHVARIWLVILLAAPLWRL